MTTIFDYLRWRGDLSFSQSPLNPVDALIFSVLAYLPFDGLVDSGSKRADADLSEIARAVFVFARSRPDLYRFHLSLWFAPEQSDAYKVAVRFHERSFAVLEKLFREAARDHGNMKGRHRAYAATFLGMLNNYVSLGLNSYAALNDALVHQSVHQFMHGIFS